MKCSKFAAFGVMALLAVAAHATVTETVSLYTDPAAPSSPVSFGFEATDVLPAGISFSGGHVFSDGDAGVGVISAKPPGSEGKSWWSFGISEPQTSTGTMTFANGANSVSFLWGSPDSYNEFSYTYTSGNSTFVNTVLGTSLDGDRSVGVYLTLTANAGDLITGLSFKSASDAFEVDNFRVASVPEPETYALMLAGLGVLIVVGHRRKS